MAGGTDQHTHKKLFSLYLLFIRIGGPGESRYICMRFVSSVAGLSFSVLVPSSFCSGMSSRERRPWSDLVHAYPQNERKVLLALLISSLLPQPRPFCGRVRLRLYKTDGVSFFLSLFSLDPLGASNFINGVSWSGLVWSGRDDSGCMLCLLLLPRGLSYQAHCFRAACNV